MHVFVRHVKSLPLLLRYHEEKLSDGRATQLVTENFIHQSGRLTQQHKLDRFEQRMSLNESSERKMMHMSINFGVGETVSDEVMASITRGFIKFVGMEKQPWLAYRHYDSAHTHCHVVTTVIDATGKLIVIPPKMLYPSHQWYREMENKYNLMRFQKRQTHKQELYAVDHSSRVRYGKAGLIRSVSSVLNTVFDRYRYTSFEAFNAILRTYNIVAQRGKEDSLLHEHRGLVYQALDDKGLRIGKAIPASMFLLKPTLKNLERNITMNREKESVHQKRVENSVNWTLRGKDITWPRFTQALEKEGISVVKYGGKKGEAEDIFFVDHRNKCSWGGSDLGAKFSLKSINSQLAIEKERSSEIILQHQIEYEL